jgi:hypothetical protein
MLPIRTHQKYKYTYITYDWNHIAATLHVISETFESTGISKPTSLLFFFIEMIYLSAYGIINMFIVFSL